MKKNVIVIISICILLSLLLSCVEQVDPRDTIVIALQGEPSTLDSQFADDGNMRAVTENVFEHLLKLDGKNLKPVPELATECKNVDSNTWEITLREDVYFHNGEPFEAKDAVFSIKRMINPQFQSHIAGNFTSIKDAVEVSRYKIKIITDGPDPILPKRLTKLDIFCKSYVENNPENVEYQPVGTGPYKVISWNVGTDIQAKVFERYWGKKPSIKNVKYLFIHKPSARLEALKEGKIDLAVNMLPEYVKEMPKTKTERGQEIYWLRLNQLKGPMMKKEIRLAANYAIDRDALADNLFLGQAVPAAGQLGKPGTFGFNVNLTAYGYDKEKAQKLLQSAGYNGELIELVSERGRWLKDGEVTEAVAAMLTDAGFNVKIKFMSWQSWLDTLFYTKNAPDMQFSSSSNDFFDMDRVYSSIIHTEGSQSVMSNEDIDALIIDARREMDTVKRQALYEELADYFYNDPYGVPLINVKDIYGMAPDLEWEPRKDSRLTVFEMSFLTP